MATYKRCDKCNRSTEEARLLLKTLKIEIKDVLDYDAGSIEVELCSDCQLELKKALGPMGARL